MVSCSTADCPSVQVLCVCVCLCVEAGRGEGGGSRVGKVKGGGEEKLTDCGEESREVGGGGRGESRVMRWWG